MNDEEQLRCLQCKIDLSDVAAYLTHDGTMICEKCAAPELAAQNRGTNELKAIPNDTLEKLKCIKCFKYLSFGPIFCENDGSVCGLCSTEGMLVRNKEYEALAHLMLFPCRFQKFGCNDSVPFSLDKEPDHELACLFRKESCPVMVPDCRWEGTKEEYVKHCEEKHPDRVVDNPLNLSYDVTVPSICTFLLKAFENLFIFHTKVCTTTSTIYHTIQCADASNCNKFDYTVSIFRGNKVVKRSGKLTPQCRFDYKSNDFIITNIKHLEKALEGLEKCVVTITINKINRSVTCGKCQKKTYKTYWFKDNTTWLCENCSPEKPTHCKNPGCNHSDFEKKCQKHELFFCPFGTWCWLCIKDVKRGDFMNHYTTKHLDVYKENEPWDAVKTGIYDKLLLLPTKFGNTVVKYKFSDTEFTIQVRTAFSSQQLPEYYCIMTLVIEHDPRSSKTYILDTVFDELYDWKLDINRDKNIHQWPDTISVKVSIEKGAKPDKKTMEDAVFQ